MKKLILPVIVFFAGLLAASWAFDLDLSRLFHGFGDFLLHIVKGSNQ
jgi:hypothetical protein